VTSAEIKLLLSTPLDNDTKGVERLEQLGLIRITYQDELVLTQKGDDLVGVILQVARLVK